MSKSADAFRTISEVADWLGVKAHVLRFWESQFPAVKPVKRAGGRRYYRPADMVLLGGLKKLLHEDGLSIKEVQKILRENGVAHVSAFSAPLDTAETETPAPNTMSKATMLVLNNKIETLTADEVSLPASQEQKPASLPEAETTAAPPPHATEQETPPPLQAQGPEPLEETADHSEPAADISAKVNAEENTSPPSTSTTFKATPGILSAIAKIKALPPAQAQSIAAVLAQLKESRVYLRQFEKE